ncbi:MAG: protein kinase [Deltaproteobacteria bacterium]|nr:protein kinase [Deltaproteobacteria bacterium]
MAAGGPSAPVVGRYQLIRRLGMGGVGEVFEAFDPEIKRRVALKLARRDADPELLVRFRREAEAAARIRHPNVVQVYDVGATERGTYVVMEYLAGVTLEHHLTARGAVSAAEILPLLIPVCDGVEAAHQAGVLHRDLKPENIFLADVGSGLLVPKVIDFGISKILTDPAKGSTKATAAIGTAHYFAPEGLLGGQIDRRVDVYALGVILYRGLTGRVPFDGPTSYLISEAIVRGNFVPARQLVPEIPLALDGLVQEAMAKDPERRITSARDLRDRLMAVLRDPGPALSGPKVTTLFAQGPLPGPPVLPMVTAPITGGQVLEVRSARPKALFVALGALLLAGVGATALGIYAGRSGRPSSNSPADVRPSSTEVGAMPSVPTSTVAVPGPASPDAGGTDAMGSDAAPLEVGVRWVQSRGSRRSDAGVDAGVVRSVLRTGNGVEVVR